jgi:hypothetical protein
MRSDHHIIDLAPGSMPTADFTAAPGAREPSKISRPGLRFRRVVPAYDGGHGIEKREPVWLLIEWRDGENEPANCFLC